MASVQQTAQHAWALPLAATNITNPLAVALALYPIQTILVSLLTPGDVVTLTQVSQTLHGHIRMDDASAKANLLSKTLCPGLGFCARAISHCPCAAKTYNPVISCARYGFEVESRPCADCGVNTCDECRIHVFYNVFTEDSGFDQRRWWAGYYFLQPSVIAVFPPKNSDNGAWHLPIKDMQPHHDQGRVHIPLNIGAIGDPEPIEGILDLDLGARHFIHPLGRTHYPYSGHQIVSFLNLIVNKRKDLACPSCYQDRQKKGLTRCFCTLRKRFLDRWLCATCYIKEDGADEDLRCRVPVVDETGHGHSHICGCGAKLASEVKPKVMCNWCKGEIEESEQGTEDDVQGANSEDINNGKGAEDEDDEEDHSAADFADLPPDDFGFAENRDGSLSVYVNGERIRGERLGRSMIRQWMTVQGKHVGCTCCVCNNRSPHYAPMEDEEGDDREDEDEDEDEAEDGDTDEAMGDDDEGSNEEDLPDLEDVESATGEDPWGLD